MSADRLFPSRSLPLLGEAIKTLRLEQGLTQAELAATAEVSRRWIGDVEAGARTSVEIARVLRVLDVLGGSLMIRDDRTAP